MGRETIFCDGRDRRIETLDVTDLQNARPRASPRRSSRSASPSECRHRLFDEHVEAGIEQPAADASVLLGGHGETDGVDTLGDKGVDDRESRACRIPRRLLARSAFASTMPTSSAPSSSRHTRT